MKDILSKVNELLNEQEDLIFDSSNVERARKQIQRQIQAPFVNVSVSNLGGTPAIMIALSLDEKNAWSNGIFENSRYARFMLEPEANKSNLEQFTLHYSVKPKFRKIKVKSVDAAINKINTWINKVK